MVLFGFAGQRVGSFAPDASYAASRNKSPSPQSRVLESSHVTSAGRSRRVRLSVAGGATEAARTWRPRPGGCVRVTAQGECVCVCVCVCVEGCHPPLHPELLVSYPAEPCTAFCRQELSDQLYLVPTPCKTVSFPCRAKVQFLVSDAPMCESGTKVFYPCNFGAKRCVVHTVWFPCRANCTLPQPTEPFQTIARGA